MQKERQKSHIISKYHRISHLDIFCVVQAPKEKSLIIKQLQMAYVNMTDEHW